MRQKVPYFKKIASHLGGTANGMVIAWPGKLAAHGDLRTRFAHLTDIYPTIMEAVGIPAPREVDGFVQERIDGVSLIPTFTDPAADRHKVQYFEITGHRAIYQDGWMASTVPQFMPWDAKSRGGEPVWHLFDLRTDFAQAKDVSAAYPARLQSLIKLWDEEATRNQVYPVDGRPTHARAPVLGAAQSHFTYWGNDVSVTAITGPSLASRSFSVTARFDTAKPDATGVLLAYGSWFGGWSFYLKDGRPVALVSTSSAAGAQYSVAAADPIPPGPTTIEYRFTSEGGANAGGEMEIFVGGKSVAKGHIQRTIMMPSGLGETLDVGRDTGTPVTDAYPGEGTFPGHIERVDLDLRPAGATSGTRAER